MQTFVDKNGVNSDYRYLIKNGGCFFIGASVTAQKNGWSDRLVDIFRENVDNSFAVSKRVMGGVGLLFGLTNWPNLDIPRNALVFIEFSTGDFNIGLTPLDQLERLLSSLVMDILNRQSLPIIVHNWRADFRGKEGEKVRGVYNNIASKLSAPVIRNDLLVESTITRDSQREKVWFRDICHTNPEGALAYAKHVFEALESIDSPGSNQSLDIETLPSFSNRVRTVLPLSDLSKYFSSLHFIEKSYSYPNTGQEFSYFDCDSSIEFEASITGELMGIAFIAGPTSGWVELFIDGEFKRKFRCFDQHSYYERFILLPVFHDLFNNDVKIRLSSDAVDFTIAKKENKLFKSERRFQLVCLVGENLILNK